MCMLHIFTKVPDSTLKQYWNYGGARGTFALSAKPSKYNWSAKF